MTANEVPGGLGAAGRTADLDTHRKHVFDLHTAPAKAYSGGRLRNADEKTFPILAGHDVSGVLVRLEPGGVREPHWHPSAWGLHYVIAGTGRFSILETEGYHEHFDATAGDVVFLPQGSLHYFENVSAEDYLAFLVFNTSAEEPRDDIGLAASVNTIPHDALGAVFGVPPEVFDHLPRKIEPVTIVRKPK
ncbi:cupin domain-containing protein [Amycolatopsis rubida]|uniref:Cupin domain-containing protein n=1 Tax=Amycolatopsis rubida TaxID=112413 RepID=A0ABX0BYA3_9PSEU|nr:MULTISPECIES: cupin domain-containing protein [Amycolatopsis]MYW94213.1 cupin domain-containing protein [Amycolatopsis rubida]NEC59202.1 cupin domain-containing protein [Amycolatopsis rubida]OAP20851.1 Oxalate decarboxylase OxdD [Amycolatopsis sp. M39]